MIKVTILRGLPASGKTTRAFEIIKSNPSTKRVNKDDLRNMIDFGVYSEDNEKMIRYIEFHMVSMLLSGGYSIVIDDTNIKNGTIEDWKKSLFHTNAEIEEIWIDTPVNECIERDAIRDKSVGKDVILALHEQRQLNNTGTKLS